MVYDKSIQKIKSTNLGTFITFIYSAFWHGVYLTYYVGKFISNLRICLMGTRNHHQQMGLSYVPFLPQNCIADYC